MTLEQEIVRTREGLADLGDAWSRLVDRCPRATPFQSPEWLLPWWDHLGGGDLRVVTLRAEGRLVAVAPLFLHVWQGKRQLSWVGVGISDMLGLLAEPDREAAAAGAVLSALAALDGGFEVCDLDEIPPGDALLDARVPPGLRALRMDASVCATVALPASIEALHASWLPEHRRNLRRARRFLEQEGTVAFERADTASRGPLLDALILLHTARWQSRGEPGVLADERLHAFHHRTSRLMLERGRLRLLALRCGGAVAAVLYGFALHGRLFAYLVGFDPKLAHASPGALLVAHAQEEAVREGLGAFELLRGREPYKAVWRPREQQNARLVLRFGGGPGPP